MMDKVINKLKKEGYVFCEIKDTDIASIIRRYPDYTLDQLCNKVKQEDYNMFSDMINDFLGY